MKKILFFYILVTYSYTKENLKDLLKNGQLEKFSKLFEELSNEEKINMKEELL